MDIFFTYTETKQISIRSWWENPRSFSVLGYKKKERKKKTLLWVYIEDSRTGNKISLSILYMSHQPPSAHLLSLSVALNPPFFSRCQFLLGGHVASIIREKRPKGEKVCVLKFTPLLFFFLLSTSFLSYLSVTAGSQYGTVAMPAQERPMSAIK